MILARVALLKKKPSPVVDQKDGEGTMQQAVAVNELLRRGADRPVTFIDKNQLFIDHCI